MKSIVFDSGPLISLTMNNLLWILEPLKKDFNGYFLLPDSVRAEVVDDAMHSKKYRFEALQILELIRKGVFKILPDSSTKKETLEILKVANSSFNAHGKNLTILHYAEVAALAAVKKTASLALIMDERVTRELIEHPRHLAKLMERKIHSKVRINSESIERFKKFTEGTLIIRSTELATIAFEKKLLSRYISPKYPNPRKTLLESILWGLKLNGCAINERGIKAILKATIR